MTKTKIIVGLLVLSFCLPVFAASENKLANDGTRQVKSVLKGKKKNYNMPVDSSFYQTLFNLPEQYCTTCSSTAERDSGLINREDQKEHLADLVNWVKKKNKKPDSQARIASSLVQNIPYDYNKSTGVEVVPSGRKHGVRYPYEVLYDNAGICGEKSFFMVYLLKELGFGTAILTFTSPAVHQAVGIKCPPAYDFMDTGYCFIDPNIRHMITYSGSYAGYNPHEVEVLSDGRTFNPKNDFKDAQTWRRLITEGISSKKNYKAYKKLVKNYGL